MYWIGPANPNCKWSSSHFKWGYQTEIYLKTEHDLDLEQWLALYVICFVILVMPWIISLCFLSQVKGTVTPFPGFDERADAETLRKAMKGLGKFNLSFVLKKKHDICFSKQKVADLQ